ncbi:putative ABC transport system permease protein [Hymenobacter daecheongensis DSM 21074]|uniref:Putative ABC transport system permease protein n=1 Tax=Hymenobacter daecheongensis DSM 21074 TaxID=1121955 RepID=A0A1M6L7B4_9BACT|nr:FtsX-like permease family protein [Hymenobacter daecheongensis]SHJ67085.1 putative ABC transport system permease protein [Hymenobacter daecheongensis DSM 21074]
MLLNYLKIAWKVLQRRKFFTFISLFGISFTLMILLVVVAMVDHVAGEHGPEKRIRQMLFVPALRQEFKGGGTMNSPLSAYFIDRYVRPMKTPALVGLTSITASTTAFANSQSVTLDVRYTDGNFWKVTDFEFIEGRAFTGREVQNTDRVCVVNEHTARAFFGTVRGVVGRQIEIGPHHYRIAGVVPNVPIVRLHSGADVWMPYTLSPGLTREQRLDGSFYPILLAASPAQVSAMHEEFEQLMRRVEIPNPKQIAKLHAHADPSLATLVRELTNHQTSADDGMTLFLTVSAVAALLFMLLPALNLINLNVTRILERASEIGVRKAFGASSHTLVGQFLVENLVLTLLGGLLGLGLAAGALHLINESQLFAYADFGLDWRAFGWALALATVFGLMSGVYPAWKMSRLNAVDALRGGATGPQ